MNDTNEIPIGSAGYQPVAWAVTPNGRDEEIDCEFIYPDAATAGDVALGCDGVVLPLYRPPPPTLADEERALLVRLGSDTREWDKYSSGRPWFVTVEDAAIIRGILERLG